VVDAGGGTVDITVHEVVRTLGGELALAEKTAGAGGLFGATYVDEAFMKHFRGKVGGKGGRGSGQQAGSWLAEWHCVAHQCQASRLLRHLRSSAFDDPAILHGSHHRAWKSKAAQLYC
jgi:hypothetical protein